MNVQKIIAELQEKYPNKTIVQQKIEDEVTEILCEIEPTVEHPDYSIAIAIINKSKVHHHKKTIETYRILKGKLELYVDENKFELNEGDEFTIHPNQIHYAIGDETWVEVRSNPGWIFEDHIF
jgi:mannose-6-phosphate isomerase-like protein (cupin superfamily)